MSSKSDPLVSIVVPCFNGTKELKRCLASLRALEYPNARIVVVDNASWADVGSVVAHGYPTAALIRLESNRGFAGAANVGIRAASGERAKYVWLLNDDVEVTPNALSRLVTSAEANPEASFVGSWIVYGDNPKTVWFGGGSYARRTGRIGHDYFGMPADACPGRLKDRKCDWISGCSVLFPVAVVNSIGFLDEDFFLYREELEWQLRVPSAARALVFGEALVRHYVGSSSGGTDSPLGRLFMSRNYLKLMRRRAGWHTPLWLARWFVDCLVVPLARGRGSLARAAVVGAFSLKTPGRVIVERHMGRQRT